ncbi:thioredoxin [Streptomyces phage SparkleGoddess]|uniref:Thioredoxin n=2 Tax=Gilsonvirus comrade TaxID=2846395 RepID=A0A345ME96_9CAUD|nr:thioredoxin [Streptomyces phage SparkleGoddess]QQO39851.1 thioredoxin [Streptomyces phage Belfort]
MGDVRKVRTLTELHEIMNNHDKVVLDLAAPSWCVPCQRLAPHFKKAAEKSDAAFVEVDIEDAEEDILNTYPTQSVPTVLLLQKGEPTVTLKGRTSVALLKEIA